MRSNLPVTNVEYSIADETLIVSKTDLKGKLTYFNDQFVQASGFTEQELIGQPHNIIRHPDMPPEAFENLWDTLKAGKPWAGAVKNRRKNGDFYWVLASATPIYEGGQVTGYMSIRTRLPSDQRHEAEQVYALLRARKANAYRIEAGMIRKRSAADMFAFFTRSLKARLGTMVGTLAAATLVVSAVGFLAMNQINSARKVDLRGSRRSVGAAVRDQRPDEGQLTGAVRRRRQRTFRPAGWRCLRQDRRKHRSDQQELVRLHGDLPHA